MDPEQIAALKQELADLKAERASLKKALDQRETDNKAERDKVKALQTELDDTKAKLPPEGSRVLTPDEATALMAYEELGKPDLLKVKLEDYDRATGEATALKRRELVDKASRDPQNETAYRYRPSVLERLLADATLTKTDKGYQVRVGEAEKSLEKWLEEDQADFMPAVTAAQPGTPAVKQPGPRTNPVTPTVEDAAKAKAASGDYHA